MVLRKLWYAVYDDPPADPPEGDPLTEPSGEGGDEPVKNQDELNSVLAREKRKFRAERDKMVKQLEKHRETATLSQKQREELETQIEELRQANMTAEERARHQQTRIEKDFNTKLEAANQQSQGWQKRYQDLKIGYEIKSAAMSQEVLPNSVEFVEALLRPATALVQDATEDGELLDSFTAKVKFPDVDKDGKPVVLTLTVEDAVKRMKELPEKYGNLFKGGAAAGLGGSTGSQGKKPDMKSMSTQEYLERRKKDPASVGLA